MKNRYHCVFVALTALLALTLAVFFLLFTDLGFSTYGHLANGNIWASNRLRVSAELAYYWRSIARDEDGVPSIVERVREGANENGDRWDRQGREMGNERLQKNVRDRGNLMREVLSPLKTGEERENEEYSLKPCKKTITSSPSLTTVHTQTPSIQQLATSEPTSTTKHTITAYVTERRKELSQDLAATQVNGNNMSTPLLTADTVLTATTEEIVTTTGTLEDANEGEILSELDEEYNTEYDNMKDTLNQYNSDDEDIKDPLKEAKDIELAFMNDDNEIAPSGAANSSQNHLPMGYIKPELMERASDVKFHMPCPKVYQPVANIVMSPWMKPLLRVLSSFEGKQVTLVIANNAYRDVLLNWLISAKIISKPPIQNVLVVALDSTLYRLLQSKDIPSILAPFSTVLNRKHRFRRFFELIMMMRLGFMRLINRLGYDCAMYDIDAIILKNPQPLYDKWGGVDIVGSRGELPRQLWRRWGVAICIGAVFIRSNTRTEIYWEAVHAARLRGGPMANDQIRLNYGLRQVHVEWERDRQTNRRLQESEPAVGRSASSGLGVVVLPFGTICRYGCRSQLRSHYFIWHKGGSRDKKSKMKGAKQGHTWFLKDRWSEIHANMVVDVRGTSWLRRISTR